MDLDTVKKNLRSSGLPEELVVLANNILDKIASNGEVTPEQENALREIFELMHEMDDFKTESLDNIVGLVEQFEEERKDAEKEKNEKIMQVLDGAEDKLKAIEDRLKAALSDSSMDNTN